MASKRRVLVVDDDPRVAASLTAFLEDEGFAVAFSGTGTDALSALAVEAIDVVIVDLRLGEMSGETFISRARQVRPRARYIIYTGSLNYRLSDAMRQIG